MSVFDILIRTCPPEQNDIVLAALLYIPRFVSVNVSCGSLTDPTEVIFNRVPIELFVGPQIAVEEPPLLNAKTSFAIKYSPLFCPTSDAKDNPGKSAVPDARRKGTEEMIRVLFISIHKVTFDPKATDAVPGMKYIPADVPLKNEYDGLDTEPF